METPFRLQVAVPELRSAVRPAQGPVKSCDNNSRRHEAATTTKRVIEAARTAFLDAGYASTTIAAAARVSADTVCKAFVGKRRQLELREPLASAPGRVQSPRGDARCPEPVVFLADAQAPPALCG